MYREKGLEYGFLEVVSGPMVRSSYRAERALELNNADYNMILISPAKRLSEQTVNRNLALTEPAFKGDADKLAKKSVKTLAKRHSKLNERLVKKLQGLIMTDTTTGMHQLKRREGNFPIRGDVFKNLDVQSLDDNDLEYMNENLRILSGIYGFLKPSDSMNPYRLEMGTKSHKPENISSLYDFWGDKVAKQNKKDAGEDLYLT